MNQLDQSNHLCIHNGISQYINSAIILHERISKDRASFYNFNGNLSFLLVNSAAAAVIRHQ